jgi:hypothetical protein
MVVGTDVRKFCARILGSLELLVAARLAYQSEIKDS